MDYAMVLDNPLTGESFNYSNMIDYRLYLTRIHNEVVSELGLDPSQMEEGSPDSLKSLKMIGERVMNDPVGQQHMLKLGLTSTRNGVPSAPGGNPESATNAVFEDEDNVARLKQNWAESDNKRVSIILCKWFFVLKNRHPIFE